MWTKVGTYIHGERLPVVNANLFGNTTARIRDRYASDQLPIDVWITVDENVGALLQTTRLEIDGDLDPSMVVVTLQSSKAEFTVVPKKPDGDLIPVHGPVASITVTSDPDDDIGK